VQHCGGRILEAVARFQVTTVTAKLVTTARENILTEVASELAVAVLLAAVRQEQQQNGNWRSGSRGYYKRATINKLVYFVVVTGTKNYKSWQVASCLAITVQINAA